MSSNTEVLNNHAKSQTNSTSGVNVGTIERVASAVAGGGLAIYGLSRRSPLGVLATIAGVAFLHRGVSGYCDAYQRLGINTTESNGRAEPVARDIHVEKSVIIDKSPAELYRFWREFENLPRFMDHLESVNTISQTRSHWKVKGPVGSTLEWDAEIYNEEPDKFIAWRSLEGEVTNAGSVHFEPAQGERGTQVKVVLNYNAPGGKVSAMLAKLFGQEPGQMIEADLHRLKEVMEAGEIATADSQPSAHAEPKSTTPEVSHAASAR
jgi:uncharacterized membrane protein